MVERFMEANRALRDDYIVEGDLLPRAHKLV